MNSILRFAPIRNSVKKFTTSTIHLSLEPLPKGKGSQFVSKWNQALAEADKLLGYPKILMNGQTLQYEDVTAALEELRKINGTNHPLRTNLKRLLFDGKNVLQSRGTIFLLFSRLIRKIIPEITKELEKITNSMATLLELINTAQDIHMGVMNIHQVDCDEETRRDLEYGNKLSILFADYLLARGHVLYNSLKHTEVVYMLSGATRDYCESQFHFDQDDQGIPYPSETSKLQDWNIYTFQTRGSLMANIFKSLIIAYECKDNSLLENAYQFGRDLGFAWQVSTELKSFLDKGHNPYSKLSLISCPVILQLQRDASLMELITPHHRDLSRVDYKKIHEIINGSPVIKETQDIFSSHVHGMLDFLKRIPDCHEKNAFTKIIHAL